MAAPAWDEKASTLSTVFLIRSSSGGAGGGDDKEAKAAAAKAAREAKAKAKAERGAAAAKAKADKDAKGKASKITEWREAPRRRRPAPEPGILPVAGKRNILVTSALPYVNNVPHLGNIIGCVLSADVYARYARQRGHNTIYICGTDEYGTATETKAMEEGLSPRAICDKYHAIHAQIYEWFDIQFDHFGRTSCEDPTSNADWPQTVIAQDIFKRLDERGQLEQQTVEQVYCRTCEKFLSDRFIEGTCPRPDCGYEDARGDQCDKCGNLLTAVELVAPRCKVCAAAGRSATEVEVRTSEHLFLNLPEQEAKLRAFIEASNAKGHWSANSLSTTNKWLAEGLRPRCVTRDLKWGTPVPKDGFRDKVFYVWFDAPIGYISITANYVKQWQQWWQNPGQVDLVQFMGKDNIPFHTVIFPSSLIGTGQDWTLLHHISTTEYLNYEDGKFSKSRGVGVFGDSAKTTGVPSEVWRYYLLANRPEVSDSVFTWTDFADKNNNELLKNLGNFVHRATSFAASAFGGKAPALGELNERDNAFVAAVNESLGRYIADMDAVHLKAGLKEAMKLSSLGNVYLQDSAPWVLKKAGDMARCGTVVSIALSVVRLLGAILEPFMPGFSDKVCYQLNEDHISVPDALELGVPAAGHALGEATPIFREIFPAEVAALRARFGGSQADAAAGGAGGAGGPASATDAAKGKKKRGEAAKGGAGGGGGGGGDGVGKKGKGGGGGGGGKKGGKAAPVPAGPPVARIDLRVGVITKVWHHPEADKLFCEEIDVGEAEPRQIASGLRPYYSLEQMQGKKICVVANLKPRPMKGFLSHGMVLCGKSADDSVVEFIDPPAGSKPGDRLIVDGLDYEGTDPDAEVNPSKKKNPWLDVAPQLKVVDGVACYGDKPFTVNGERLTAPTLKAGIIS